MRVTNFWSKNYIDFKSNGDRNKKLLLKEYSDKIKPYLMDIIIDLQQSDTLKIQLTIAISFIFSKDAEEERVMHSYSNNIKFTPYNNANKVAVELFKSLLSRYQNNLEKSMRGSYFIFDSVQMMHYKCHQVNSRNNSSYIRSPD